MSLLSIKEGWKTGSSTSSKDTTSTSFSDKTSGLGGSSTSGTRTTSTSSSGSRRTSTSSTSTSSSSSVPPSTPYTQDTQKVETFAKTLGSQVTTQRTGTYGSTPAVTTKTPTPTPTTTKTSTTITPPSTQDTKAVETFAKQLGTQTTNIGTKPAVRPTKKNNTIFTNTGSIKPYNQTTYGVGSNIDTRQIITRGKTDWTGTKEQGIQSAYFDTAYNIDQTRKLGQEYIDFNPDMPVTIDGKEVSGKDVLYTVKDFQPRFLYGHTTNEKGSTKTLSAQEYDTYLENIGKNLLGSVKGFDSDALRTEGYNAQSNWHPDTKALKTATGIQFDFPYAGAENYYSYKKDLEKSGFAGLFATALTGNDFLGIPSAYYTATGQKQKAIDLKIQAMHSTKEGFVPFALKMPTTQIGIAAIGGSAWGAGSTYATGYITGKFGATSAAMFAFKGGEIAAGAIFGGLAIQNVKNTFETQGIGEGLGGLVGVGLSAGAGYGGYKIGQTTSYRNVGLMRRGYQRGFEKRILNQIAKGDISGEKGVNLIRASQLEFNLRQNLGNIKTDQGTLNWEKVQEFEQRPMMREFTQKYSLQRKSELYGSLTEGRDTVHDVDIMLAKLSKGGREFRYASERFGYGKDASYMDIKPMQKGIVGRSGTIKQPSYEYPGGWKGMRWSESAMRHGESALELAHSGRVKDIPRSVELYTKLWKSSGSPKKLGSTIQEYATVMSTLEKDPYVMPKLESNIVYGKSIGQRWSGFKTKAYTKIVPERIQVKLSEMSFQKTMQTNIPGKVKNGVISSNNLPPSISSSYSAMVTLPSISVSSTIGSVFTSLYRSPSLKTNTMPSSIMGKKISISTSPSSKSYYSSPSKKPYSSSYSTDKKSLSTSVSSISKTLSNIASPFTSSTVSSLSIASSTTSSVSSVIKPSPSVSISKPKAVLPIPLFSVSSSPKKTSSSFFKSPSPSPISSFIPPTPSGIYGRGAMGWGSGEKRPRYLFRKFKLPSLKEIFKGVKM